ncbi:RICIN domain-containing protein [Streptomyces sp. NPDC020801]|uniref:RICIN domain-containing protein n=1 Tax=unclassified Streptomyces TaxID=2593676 RepID=UPI0037ABB249
MKKIHVVAVSVSGLSVLLGVTLIPSASAQEAEHRVTIQSAAVEAALDATPVPGGQFQLRQTAPAGTASQQWVLTDVGQGWSQIRNAESGYCLDGSGNYVLLMKCASTDDPSQRWKTLPADAKSVMLTSEAAAEGAVVRGDITVPGSVMYLSEPQGDGARFRWKLEDVPS